MVKLVGLDVPPELAQLWDKYASLTAVGQGPDEPIRTRRAATIPKPKRWTTRRAYQRIAEQLLEGLRWQGVPDIPADFIKQETARLTAGFLDPRYWQQCTQTATTTIKSTPSSVADDTTDAYAYRDPAKLKTTPTYPAGAAFAATPKSSGAVSAGRWRDGDWIWRRTIFALDQVTNGNTPVALIWKSSGTITVAATVRGSRPMHSLVMKAFTCLPGDPPITTLAAPAHPFTSIYSRYTPPDVVAPYYASVIPAELFKPISDRALALGGNTASRAVILSAPRPMFGHGFNNNDTASTEWASTEQLWQTKKYDRTPGTGYGDILVTVRDAVNDANDPVYYSFPRKHKDCFNQAAALFEQFALQCKTALRWSRDINPAQKGTKTENSVPPAGWTQQGLAPFHTLVTNDGSNFYWYRQIDTTGWPMGWGNLPIVVVQYYTP